MLQFDPVIRDILVPQGADFSFEFQMLDDADEPIDLTGCTIEGQIRKTATEGATLIAAFSGEIVDGPEGIAAFSLPAATTEEIVCNASPEAIRSNTLGAYDVKVVFSGGEKVRVLQGVAYISPQATQEDEEE